MNGKLEEILDRSKALSGAEKALLIDQIKAKLNEKNSLLSNQEIEATSEQYQMWVNQKLYGCSSKYNMVTAYKLDTSIDINKLIQSIDAILASFDIFKVVFLEKEGGLFQTIREEANCCKILELTSDQELKCRLIEMADDPLDMSQGPLVKFSVFKVDSRYTLTWCVHHSIFDGYSKSILLRALNEAYTHNGYFDFEEHGYITKLYATETEQDEDIDFWKGYLKNVKVFNSLPFDHNLSKESSVGIVPLDMNEELSAAVKYLAKEHQVSLYVFLLAVFKSVLKDITGENDQLIGTPVDLRQGNTHANTIGCFLNTLVIRSKLESANSLHDIVNVVDESAKRALSHRATSLAKIVESVGVQKAEDITPIFQIMFVMQHNTAENASIGNSKLEPISIGAAKSKYDIYFTFKLVGNRLKGWITYNSTRYRSTTIEELRDYYFDKLYQITNVSDIERSCGDSNNLSQSCNYDEKSTLLSYLLSGLDEKKSAFRFVNKNSSIFISEIIKEAAIYAANMSQEGVVCGDYIAIIGLPDRTYFAAMIATWSLGCIAVPLSSSLPVQRIKGLLSEIDIKGYVTNVAFVFQALPQYKNLVQTNDLLNEKQLVDTSLLSRYVNQIDSDFPAVLLFTSGSTGKQKAVLKSHRSILSRILSQLPYLNSDDVIIQKTSIGFVDSLVESWSAVIAGATLIHANPELIADPFELADLVEQYKATVLYLVPTNISYLLDAFPDQDEKLKSLRAIFASGEMLLPAVAAKAQRHLRVKLYNVYGTTEAADVTIAQNDSTLLEDGSIIGSPFPGLEVHVLDSEGSPCHKLRCGELCVEGDVVAYGYVNDSRSTAESFLPSPANEKIGARVYATGDFVRYQKGEQLEFLGRKDRQRNIHGVKVYYDEMEALIEAIPDVLVCKVDEVNIDGSDLTVAYVELSEETTKTSKALRKMLMERVPAYMVPAIIKPVSSMPLLSNGKVDAEKLKSFPLDKVDVECRTNSPNIETMIGLWRKNFPGKEIIAGTSFFELGGHSLLAIKLARQISDFYSVSFEAVEVLNNPSAVLCAERVDELLLSYGSPNSRSNRAKSEGYVYEF